MGNVTMMSTSTSVSQEEVNQVDSDADSTRFIKGLYYDVS